MKQGNVPSDLRKKKAKKKKKYIRSTSARTYEELDTRRRATVREENVQTKGGSTHYDAPRKKKKGKGRVALRDAEQSSVPGEDYR